jgi:predicted dehydrogenase
MMKFGILGEAKIARNYLAPAILEAGHEITHIGRRNPTQKKLPEIYQDAVETSYDDLLSEPSIDAIYIPLPNHLHVPYSIAALKAGKHVLCEKPVALNLDELAQLESVATTSKLYFQEAFMVKYHPQWHWLQELDIGNIQTAHFIFSYPHQPEGNYRNSSSFGGGPLYDIGCYAILTGCLLFDGIPEVVSAIAKMDDKFDVEKQVDAILRWPNGEVLNFTVSGDAALCQSLHVLGDNGWTKLDVPVNPPEITHAYWSKGGLEKGERISFPRCDQYKLMIDDFVAQVNSGATPDFSVSRVITNAINQIQVMSGISR